MSPVVRTCVVIPIRSFDLGKSRLATILDAQHRRDLVRSLAQQVIRAAFGHAVFVVSNDTEVLQWCFDNSIDTIEPETSGLNEAVKTGLKYVSDDGFGYCVVTHCDLPLVDRFDHIFDHPVLRENPQTFVIVPDRHMAGTNVLGCDPRIEFEPRYGSDSLQKHLELFTSMNVDVEVVRDPRLGVDLDVAEDLKYALSLGFVLPGESSDEEPSTTDH